MNSWQKIKNFLLPGLMKIKDDEFDTFLNKIERAIKKKDINLYYPQLLSGRQSD